jgi:hypothetical protein
LNQQPTLRKFKIKIDPTNKSFVGFRYCKKCNDIKPPRTHHCSICGKCVMRMDHHCPWTGNCVGLKTHKYFMCFTFWTVIACLHVGLTTPILNKHISWNISKVDFKWVESHGIFNPLAAQMMSLSVSFGVAILMCMHISFLRRNESSIEAAELIMYGNPYRMPNPDDNLKQLLGPIKLHWFWPVLPS